MWETDLETFGKWKNLEGKVQECEESSQIYVTGTNQEGEKNNAKKKKIGKRGVYKDDSCLR